MAAKPRSSTKKGPLRRTVLTAVGAADEVREGVQKVVRRGTKRARTMSKDVRGQIDDLSGRGEKVVRAARSAATKPLGGARTQAKSATTTAKRAASTARTAAKKAATAAEKGAEGLREGAQAAAKEARKGS